ncbi:MAG TPA: diadenylate cyclase CdaA [Methylomusa anaerophila]|uniref:Diadenylate cyclase n=1 Tax=Methylomusa anaerophila TaxID=1930071 RepID=A0A348AK26_9FIRM|nr:diadenylate cyclase CdaA [Methylomusa anaerophila]BBB91424.1 DNA integrity scanning protein DisA [Methylomusa anaerophila]HML90152.1 diadenylate cyclase CdaA [Methylomusa anaerophila]
MLLQIKGIISTINLLDIADIVIVAVVLYKLYFMIKDSRAVALLKGLIVLLLATLVSKWLGLNVVNWLLQKSMTVVLVALPVVFQPELRRALEHLGRGRFFQGSSLLNAEEKETLFAEIARTVAVLSKNKIGALIVLERDTGLNDYIETGIKVDGLITSEFLTNVFIPNTPLHDGAVIIRGNRMQAAGCLLPLTEDRSLSKELGTRHRAAIGITEQTDAVVIVVSEETGIISVARGGRLIRYIDCDKLVEHLRPLFAAKPSSLSEFFSWRPPNAR